MRVVREQKVEIYQQVTKEISATLKGETDLIASMATIACLLHHSFDYFFWTGFY
jgi:L-methionine (R)-S-oxide reductase